MSGHLSLGDLLVFVGYVAAINGPLTSLVSAVGTAVTMGPRGRRVLEIIDSDEQLPEKAHPLVPARFSGEIALDDVTLSYDGADGKKIFEHVSCTARPGEVTAIIGITGAGKSSLIGLLSRFYDPTAGAVRFDGHDLRDLSLKWVRENVSVVLQDPILFPATIAENIAFGAQDVTDEQVMNAARVARAHDFIQRLPLGYDTRLGENAASLSGGERQRIALARALLKDAPVVIMDEPTSSLDAHTEAEIFDALREYLKGRTTFIISHRLSTIRRADQIISLENGRIVERGTHETLVKGSGVYARLYRNQNIAAADDFLRRAVTPA
jgi:ABC-type multidrug transport system fused ATPase/permease subunit